MPLWDWQFLVVTLIAMGAMWMLARRTVLPARKKTEARKSETPACAHCVSNAQQTRQPSRTTTVPVVALSDLRRQRDAREHAGPRHERERPLDAGAVRADHRP
jgi:hypothetical protein